MSKIIVLSYKLEMGGVEITLLELLRKLVEYGNDVTLLLIQNSVVLKERVPNKVKIREISFGKNSRLDALVGRSGRNVFINKLKNEYVKLVRSRLKQNAAKNELYPYLAKKVKKGAVESEIYDLLLDFYGYGYFLTEYGAVCIRAKKKALWVHD